MSPLFKRFLKSIAIVFGIAVLLLILVIIISTDEPIGFNNLELHSLGTSKNNNAYDDLRKAREALKIITPSDEVRIARMVDGAEVYDSSFATPILDNTKDALGYWEGSFIKGVYQNPAMGNPFLVRPSLVSKETSDNQLVLMTSIARLKALALFDARRYDDALLYALRIVQVGQKIQNSQDTIATYLTGRDVVIAGYESMQDIVRRGVFSPETLTYYANEIQKNSDQAVFLLKPLQVEASLKKASVDDFTNKFHSNADFYYQPNATKNYFLADIGREQERTSLACAQVSFDEVGISKSLQDEISATGTIQGIFVKNGVGKTFYSKTRSNYAFVQKARCELEMARNATSVVLGTKAYWVSKRAYPNELSEISPAFIAKLPLDPFSGKAFRYNNTAHTIYSVGMDKVQSSGEEKNLNWRNQSDPAFSVGFE